MKVYRYKNERRTLTNWGEVKEAKEVETVPPGKCPASSCVASS